MAKHSHIKKPDRKAVTRTVAAMMRIPGHLYAARKAARALSVLRREQQRLQGELARQELLIQDHPATGHHLADDASDVTEEVTELALRRHLEGLLQEIERAILRADRGTYGCCERCGRPIDAARLRVVPSASLCIQCAKAQGQSGRVENHSAR